MRSISLLFSLLLAWSCWAQPAPINRRAMALAGLASAQGTTPFDVSAKLMAWYNATNIFTFGGSASGTNQAVTLIKDLVNGFDLTNSQAGLAVWPTNRFNIGASGSNCVIWTNSNVVGQSKAFTNTAVANIVLHTNWSVYFVLEVFADYVNQDDIELAINAAAPSEVFDWRHSTDVFKLLSSAGPATIPRNKWMTVGITNGNSGSGLFTNGVFYTSASRLDRGITNILIGVPNGLPAVMGWEEELVYSNCLSPADFTILQNYFNGKYPGAL